MHSLFHSLFETLDGTYIWQHESYKLVHNTIHLVISKLEIVVNVLTIGTTPNEEHIGFNFATCNMSQWSIRYVLTRTMKFLVLLQDMITVFPLWRNWNIDILEVKRHTYQTIWLIHITGTSTPGSRVKAMDLGCSIDTNMTTFPLSSLFNTYWFLFCLRRLLCLCFKAIYKWVWHHCNSVSHPDHGFGDTKPSQISILSNNSCNASSLRSSERLIG